MSWQDLVNAGYESIGGLMIFLHCLALYRDKEVKGVSVFATVIFTSWGYWNLYYYPHLNQWASFFGGVVIVLANTLWVGMMWYYLRAAKRRELEHAMDSWTQEHKNEGIRREERI
jgi:uncharacterized membrane protein YfcA